MTLDREQWIHLATANAAIIRADLDRLRNLLTEGPQAGYAEFWAQARDIAAKFKTFKPIEAEARENLWSDYRAICEATRALQESERGQFTEESKAKREQIEAALSRAAETVEAAQTPQELSRAQSLLDQILNQMKTRPAKDTAPRREPAPAPLPSAHGEPPGEPSNEPPVERPVEASAALPQATEESAPAPDTLGQAHAEVRDERVEGLGEIPPPPGDAPAPEADEEPMKTEAATTEADMAGPAGEGSNQALSVDSEPADHEALPPQATSAKPGTDSAAVNASKDAPMLLRSDREACWIRWTQIRDVLKAKRTEHRRHLLEAALERAQQILASIETQDPRTVQETIRIAQGELKTSGLSLAEQETVRGTLRSAWKASSERIESLRQERQKAHSEWLERMSTHLSRWETQVLKSQATAVQIQGEVADLESQAAGTSDDGRGAKLRQWINGKRGRLADLEASIKELGQKVHTVRAKMGKEAPSPITELSEEDLAAATRPSPPPDRRPDTVREARGSSRGPSRGPGRNQREERPSEPPSHPGLNLGELLAQHLGLAFAGKVAEIKVAENKVAENKVETSKVEVRQAEDGDVKVAEGPVEVNKAEDGDGKVAEGPVEASTTEPGKAENPEAAESEGGGTEAEG